MAAWERSRSINRLVLAARSLATLGEAYAAIGDLDRARKAQLESEEFYKRASLPTCDQGQLTHSSVPSVNT
jgi:hypothetical protein